MQRYIFFVNERQQKTAEILVFQGISAVLFFYCGRIVLAKRGSIWHIGGGKGDGTFTPQAWAGSFPPQPAESRCHRTGLIALWQEPVIRSKMQSAVEGQRAPAFHCGLCKGLPAWRRLGKSSPPAPTPELPTLSI